MYEVLRRRGNIHETCSIVVDTNISSFEEFDKILDLPDTKPNKYDYQEDLNGTDSEEYVTVLSIYGN